MDVGKTPAANHKIKYTITIMSLFKTILLWLQYDKDDDQ